MSYSGMRVHFPSVKSNLFHPPLMYACQVVDGLIESIFLSFTETLSYTVGLCNSLTIWAHLDIHRLFFFLHSDKWPFNEKMAVIVLKVAITVATLENQGS